VRVKTMENIIYLALGWLIGLLSPTITEKIKKEYKKEELLYGFLSELEETKYRLALMVYILEADHGVLNRELVQWAISNIENYEGSYADEIDLDALKKITTYPDEQFEAFSKLNKEELINKPTLLKKYDLLFLESNFTAISIFDRQFQFRIIEIKSRIRTLNAEIDRNNFFYEKTFDSSITGNNHQIIVNNLQEGQKHVITISKKIVSAINNLVARYKSCPSATEKAVH
jgi:hypothetical protein